MNTSVEKALQKMVLMGCRVYPIEDYYLIEDRVAGFKVLREKRGDVLESPFFEKVQRLGKTKLLVSRGGRFGIFDTVVWEESAYYRGLEVREVYGEKFYLVYKMDGFYGVIDDEDNQIIPHKYTFINFVSMGDVPPVIIATRVESREFNGLVPNDELYSIRGEFYPVSRVIRGKPYFILGDKVYVGQGTDVMVYNLKGEVIRNGGIG